ncbi:ParA family protein [Vallicoccus soli]|uniref:ParA family protein n=1 Tax=Vallicoccus soli TaxID=2339232 RepID=A0A3A3ZNB2_9ACTN|nr:ParA family protein [Vallicoccus soli]
MVSLKGGVGKTSVVLGLAGAALERGVRTLVVDLDPQANASTVLDPREVTYTSNDVLADARAGVLRQAVSRSGWGDLVDVVVAERALEHRNRDLPSAGRDGTLRLRIAMDGLDGYDLVLVDSPPSLGDLTRNALAASHRALVVTEPTLFALHGAQQALDAVDVVRRSSNLRLRPAGVVVNRVRARSAEHAYRLRELEDAYDDLLLTPALPDRAAVQQAAGAYVPVQAYRSPGAREVGQVLGGYLERLLGIDGASGPLGGRAGATRRSR